MDNSPFAAAPSPAPGPEHAQQLPKGYAVVIVNTADRRELRYVPAVTHVSKFGGATCTPALGAGGYVYYFEDFDVARIACWLHAMAQRRSVFAEEMKVS